VLFGAALAFTEDFLDADFPLVRVAGVFFFAWRTGAARLAADDFPREDRFAEDDFAVLRFTVPDFFLVACFATNTSSGGAYTGSARFSGQCRDILTVPVSPDAIFIDLDCRKAAAPAPVLLGVLNDVGGKLNLAQVIVDDRLRKAAAARRGVTTAGMEAAIARVASDAIVNDCPIVGWSLVDRDVLLRSGIQASLKKIIRARYINALEIARSWRGRLYREVRIGRDTRFDPRQTLDKYAALAGDRQVDGLHGTPARWIRRVQAALNRTPDYRSVREDIQKDWLSLLDHNAHELKALRHVWSTASYELEKWREYEQSNYCVDQERGRPVCFKVGATSARLDALLARLGARRWAFITAWNPASVSLTRDENDRRQATLIALLSAHGYRAVNGRGMANDGAWSEESLLVLDITTRMARRLGRQFGQFAIVIGSRGATARLISCAVPVRSQARPIPFSSASAAPARRPRTARRPSGR